MHLFIRDKYKFSKKKKKHCYINFKINHSLIHRTIFWRFSGSRYGQIITTGLQCDAKQPQKSIKRPQRGTKWQRRYNMGLLRVQNKGSLFCKIVLLTPIRRSCMAPHFKCLLYLFVVVLYLCGCFPAFCGCFVSPLCGNFMFLCGHFLPLCGCFTHIVVVLHFCGCFTYLFILCVVMVILSFSM